MATVSLTSIRYISGISRSVISEKIQNLLFSPWWRHTGPIFYDVICIHYYISYPNYRSHEINHVTSSVLDITWWTGLLKKIRENPSFLQKYPFRNISIIFMSLSEMTLTHFPKSDFLILAVIMSNIKRDSNDLFFCNRLIFVYYEVDYSDTILTIRFIRYGQ